MRRGIPSSSIVIETVKGTLQKTDEGALNLLHLGGVEGVSEILGCV